MNIEGTVTLPVRAEHLWHLLMDPSVLQEVIPGCRELEKVDDSRYEGVIAAKLGPVESRFETDFTISDTDYPHRFLLNVMGEGTGGFVTSDVHFKLARGNGNTTLLRYDIEADVGGKLAAIGQRLIRAAARTMIKKGFGALRTRVEQEAADDTASGDVPESEESRPKQ